MKIDFSLHCLFAAHWFGIFSCFFDRLICCGRAYSSKKLWWKCEKGPDHSYFGGFRKRLGTENLMRLFSLVRDSLKGMGLIREVFTFVDASQLISKLTTWDDRDKAIKAGLETFNNETAPKVATDTQARFGCKGNTKFWYS